MKSDTQKGQQTLKIVFLTLFLDLVGFSIIFPLFPDLLDYYIPEGGSSNSKSILAQLVAPLYQLAELSAHPNPKFITTVLFGANLGQFIRYTWSQKNPLDNNSRTSLELLNLGFIR